jgi:ATP-binding cassette subfamily C protein LapB
LILARVHNRPAAADGLTAGLPLEEHRLTPQLFPRAAARAGLSAKVVERELAAISDLVLPAILLLKHGQACVLVRKLGKDNASVMLPESGTGIREISVDELHSHYAGYAIFTAPAERFDQIPQTSGLERPRRWFRDVVVGSWRIYGEVVVASFLINIFALVVPLFTMNVYDRVVPNAAVETLWALTIGVAIVMGFDLLMRTLRGYFIDVAGKRIDTILSANIFERVLGIRLAAKPGSVGAFAHSLQNSKHFENSLRRRRSSH